MKLNLYVIVDKENKIVRYGNGLRQAIYNSEKEAQEGLQWGNLIKRNCSIKRLEEV